MVVVWRPPRRHPTVSCCCDASLLGVSVCDRLAACAPTSAGGGQEARGHLLERHQPNVSPDRLSPGDFFQRLRLHVSSRHPDGKSGVKGGGGEAICDIKRYPVTLNDARSALSTCVVTCELTVVVRRDDGKRLVLLFVDEIARSNSPPPPPPYPHIPRLAVLARVSERIICFLQQT